jgi:hypothetical protein
VGWGRGETIVLQEVYGGRRASARTDSALSEQIERWGRWS